MHGSPKLVAVHRAEATAHVNAAGAQQLNGLVGSEVSTHRRHTDKQQRRATVLQSVAGPRIKLEFTLRPERMGQPAASIA